jgi:hypothetical protein
MSRDEPISREELPTHEVRVADLEFRQIDQNPYRDLVGNPLMQEQVELLAASVESTGYWSNTLVRPHPRAKGRYQLAYGHARLEAAKLAGLVRGSFTVRDLSDEDMLRIMTDENVTQFGKDRFAVYKEATVAAAAYIMLEVLDDPASAQNFLGAGARPQDVARFVNTIRAGEGVGEETIARFYKGTLNIANIRSALKVWHDTGELAAWHRKHNRNAAAGQVKPTLDPEALRRFAKSDHVRTFVKAVQETNTPVELQAAVADAVIHDLAPPPSRSRTGREAFQSSTPSDERFNSKNIRERVIKAATKRARSAKDKARYEAMERMASLERALFEIEAGLSRALSGYTHMRNVLGVIGQLADTDMTVIAEGRIRRIAETLAELEPFLTHPPVPKQAKRIKAGGDE